MLDFVSRREILGMAVSLVIILTGCFGTPSKKSAVSTTKIQRSSRLEVRTITKGTSESKIVGRSLFLPISKVAHRAAADIASATSLLFASSFVVNQALVERKICNLITYEST